MQVPTFPFATKILAWLDHLERKPELATGLGATQAGIVNATGLSRGHGSRTLAPLIADGFVEKDRRRVDGFMRSLIGYRLTARGRDRVRGLTAKLAPTIVEVRRWGEGNETLPLGDAMARAKPPLTLHDVLHQLELRGFVDLEDPTGPRAGSPRFIFE